MAIADVAARVRQILYGTGQGERPALRIAASNANESTSGNLVTFSVVAGQGAKVAEDDILAVQTSVAADAHVIYVTGVSTDAVTGINGYLGSPVVIGSDSGDLDNAVLEQRPLVTSYEILEAVNTCIANLLWPHVYDIETASVSAPDITFGTEEVAATVEEIISAWQVHGGREWLIPVTRQPYDVHTSVSSTGRLAVFDWLNGDTGYYTYRSKYAIADEADTEITHLIALGAAAILMGASISETTIEPGKKDNMEAVSMRGSAADRVWRDFLTLRQSMAEDQIRRLPARIVFNRG